MFATVTSGKKPYEVKKTASLEHAEVSRVAKSKTQQLVEEHKKLSLDVDKPLTTTESPHTDTKDFSDRPTTEGLQMLFGVDIKALTELKIYSESVNQIAERITAVIRSKNRVMVSGCGSAGRMVTQAINECCRQFPELTAHLFSLMAGGPTAIFTAKESVEDSPEAGKEHLKKYGGIRPGDQLIAVSASGGAGYVHGQIKYVLSKEHRNKPILITNNTLPELLANFSLDEKTCFHGEKYKEIEIHSHCVRQMAIAGSTRMQAGTAQLSVLKFAILKAAHTLKDEKFLSFEEYIDLTISALSNLLRQTEFKKSYVDDLAKFVDYVAERRTDVRYVVNDAAALGVISDLAECTPTFNAPPACFEIMGRPVLNGVGVLRVLYGNRGFVTNLELNYTDYGQLQDASFNGAKKEKIIIEKKPNVIQIGYGSELIKIYSPRDIVADLVFKMVLNAVSTAVWRDRIHGNQMIALTLTNTKLISRTISVIQHIITTGEHKLTFSKRFLREEIRKVVYEMMLNGESDEKFVLKAIANVRANLAKIPTPEFKKRKPEVEVCTAKIKQAMKEGRDIATVECGGTWTRFRVYAHNAGFAPYTFQFQESKDGILKEGHDSKGPGANINAEDFFAKFDEAVRLAKINVGSLTHEYLDFSGYLVAKQPIIISGAAGMKNPAMQEKFRKGLVERISIKPEDIVAYGDVELNVAALHSYGIVLTAGSGSSCFGISDTGERIQGNGLGGHLAQDPGSAVSAGIRAAINILKWDNKSAIYDPFMNSFNLPTDLDKLYRQEVNVHLEKIKKESKDFGDLPFVNVLNRDHDGRLKLKELAECIFRNAFAVKSPQAQRDVRLLARELAIMVGETLFPMFAANENLSKFPFEVTLIGGIWDTLFYDQFFALFMKEFDTFGLKVELHCTHDASKNHTADFVENVIKEVRAQELRADRDVERGPVFLNA